MSREHPNAAYITNKFMLFLDANIKISLSHFDATVIIDMVYDLTKFAKSKKVKLNSLSTDGDGIESIKKCMCIDEWEANRFKWHFIAKSYLGIPNQVLNRLIFHMHK